MKKSIAVAFAAMILLTGCGQKVVIDEEPAPPRRLLQRPDFPPCSR